MFANEISDFFFYIQHNDDLNKKPEISDFQRKI